MKRGLQLNPQIQERQLSTSALVLSPRYLLAFLPPGRLLHKITPPPALPRSAERVQVLQTQTRKEKKLTTEKGWQGGGPGSRLGVEEAQAPHGSPRTALCVDAASHVGPQ